MASNNAHLPGRKDSEVLSTGRTNISQEIGNSGAVPSSRQQDAPRIGFIDQSRSSSYASHGDANSRRSLMTGFDWKGVGWKNRWVVLIAALWLQVTSSSKLANQGGQLLTNPFRFCTDGASTALINARPLTDSMKISSLFVQMQLLTWKFAARVVDIILRMQGLAYM